MHMQDIARTHRASDVSKLLQFKSQNNIYSEERTDWENDYG
jgi:hypothetical protein